MSKYLTNLRSSHGALVLDEKKKLVKFKTHASCPKAATLYIYPSAVILEYI